MQPFTCPFFFLYPKIPCNTSCYSSENSLIFHSPFERRQWGGGYFSWSEDSELRPSEFENPYGLVFCGFEAETCLTPYDFVFFESRCPIVLKKGHVLNGYHLNSCERRIKIDSCAKTTHKSVFLVSLFCVFVTLVFLLELVVRQQYVLKSARIPVRNSESFSERTAWERAY